MTIVKFFANVVLVMICYPIGIILWLVSLILKITLKISGIPIGLLNITFIVLGILAIYNLEVLIIAIIAGFFIIEFIIMFLGIFIIAIIDEWVEVLFGVMSEI